MKRSVIPIIFNQAVVLLLLANLFSLNAHAQTKMKTHLTEQDYKLWGYLSPRGISQNGKWISFSVSYETGEDTLFVSDIDKGIVHYVPNSRNGCFLAGRWFSSLDNTGKLFIKDLRGSKNYTLSDISSVVYDSERAIVIYRQKKGNALHTSMLMVQQGNNEDIKNAVAIDYSKAAGRLAYCIYDSGKYRLKVLDPISGKGSELLMAEQPYSGLQWDSNGKKLLFVSGEANGDKSLGIYDLTSAKAVLFHPERYEAFGTTLNRDQKEIKDVVISEDGKRIFWKALINRRPVEQNNLVQVWHSNDKRIYPLKQYGSEPLDGLLTVMWEPMTDGFSVLTDEKFTEGIFNADKTCFLSSGSDPYEPHNRFHPYKDYVLTDLKRGIKRVVLQAYGGEIGTVQFSPGGKYISYFKNRNWWLFDIEKNLHKCLTDRLPADFSMAGDIPNQSPPFGSPLWAKGDAAVFLYDEFDIWTISTSSMESERITSGKEKGQQFRLADMSILPLEDNREKRIVELSSATVLQIKADTLSGYAYYKSKGTIRPIILKDSKFTDFIVTATGVLIYTEQNFSIPPALVAFRPGRPKADVIFQSNPHYRNYQWGKARSFRFYNAQGKSLKGILYYPADYDPAKLYPMIVHVYDKQSSKRTDYVNPSQFNENGFNIANLTAKGYFVMLPDITFEAGNPGLSATDCVTAAVKEALTIANINKKKIGLIGHSFGGYLTDFILTRTHLFAAAVSGAAITDLVSSYLYVSWKFALPNFFHYENGQLRMGGLLHGNYLGYINNSPLYHAEHITTPLLSWCGEDDSQVDPSQSLEFYLALRRLGKVHSLLVFPGQQHVLTDSVKQDLLTRSIEGWFGYYLKDEGKPQWIGD